MSGVIKFDSVSKRFGSTQALNDVSLVVPRGVVFALLGENGAGKTTAIQSLLGLQTPNRGRIEVFGKDPRQHGVELRRRIGYVPDNPALYDWMTVKETGWFAAGFHEDGFEAEFVRLCEEFELDLSPKVKQLSKGGRAKVGLALALAHRPDLLILDEPTSGLDTLVRRKFLESMVDVAAEGRTVLLSSHQIPEVERVADFVAIINEGKLLVCDRLENLKQDLERWVVTLEQADVKQLPVFEGVVLTHEGKGSRRQQLMVKNPGPDALWTLRDHSSVVEVEVHTPSLEEIFVAYLKAPEIDAEPSGFAGQLPTPPVKEGGR